MPVGEGDQLAVHALVEVGPVEAVGLPGELDEGGHLRRDELGFLRDIDDLPARRHRRCREEGGQQEDQRSFLHMG